MRAVLRLPQGSDDTVHAAYRSLLDALVVDPDAPPVTASPTMRYGYRPWSWSPPQLSLANRIWGDDSITWRPSFLHTLNDSYAAPAEITDIHQRPEEVRGEVNRWVAGRTRGMIPELLWLPAPGHAGIQ